MERLFESEQAVAPAVGEHVNWSRVAKAVEMLLAARLMLRGHHVSIPLEDDGVDLLVDYRVAVQVKMGGRRRQHGSLELKLRGPKGARNRARGKPVISSRVDVLAVYARDSEAWWFIPRSALELLGHGDFPGCLVLTEHLPSRRTRADSLSSYLNAWHVFGDDGFV